MPDLLATSQAAVFPSALGWFALVYHSHCGRTVLSRLSFGCQSEMAALSNVQERGAELDVVPDEWPEEVSDWIDRLQRYAQGQRICLSDIAIDESYLTPFGKSVLRMCRDIAYGQTLSYGQLAIAAGRPRAARAVGSVMANNRTPLVVPCHRVLGAGGKLGGFSAPQGVAMKQRLLEIEGNQQLWHA